MMSVKLFIMLLMASALSFSILASPPDTQKNFSLEQYMGHWWQIALIPTRFQKMCVGQAHANYTLLSSGDVMIVNQCVDKHLKLRSAEGIAKVNEVFDDAARLRVRFAPSWLSALPMVWGDYWVLDIESDYSAALVGSPDRKYLWVLARSPKVSEEVYQRLTATGSAEGFDISQLVLESSLFD
jgi:apolipoprotein D and lipocalin family protein